MQVVLNKSSQEHPFRKSFPNLSDMRAHVYTNIQLMDEIRLTS